MLEDLMHVVASEEINSSLCFHSTDGVTGPSQPAEPHNPYTAYSLREWQLTRSLPTRPQVNTQLVRTGYGLN